MVIQDSRAAEGQRVAQADGLGGREGQGHQFGGAVAGDHDVEVPVPDHVQNDHGTHAVGTLVADQRAGQAPAAMQAVGRAVAVGALFTVQEGDDDVERVRSRGGQA